MQSALQSQGQPQYSATRFFTILQKTPSRSDWCENFIRACAAAGAKLASAPVGEVTL